MHLAIIPLEISAIMKLPLAHSLESADIHRMQDSKKSVFHWDSSELALIPHHPNFQSSLCFALVLISQQTLQSMSDKLFNIILWLHKLLLSKNEILFGLCRA